MNATACKHCGSQTFILAGDTPDCLPCFLAREKATIGAEKAATGLVELLEVVRDLPPDLKAVLRNDVIEWRVYVEQIAWAVKP